MTTDTIHFTASDGTNIAVHRWIPEEKPLAVIQIAHGMMEFAQRYAPFAERAVKLGYAVIANDARAHGMTAGTLEALGHLDEPLGFSRCEADLHEITGMAQNTWPGIPVFLFGHSWGSFLSQMYLERHGDILAGCVLSGTRGPDPIEVGAARILTTALCAAGKRGKRSPFLFALSFASCNARIRDPKSANAWLSSDEGEVARYDASPWCGFMPTAGFWANLMEGLSEIHRKDSMAAIPKNVPVLLIAGSGDPIGKYGKTIDRLEKAYRKNGMTDLRRITYPGARHEALNDACRERVMDDVFTWIAVRLTASTGNSIDRGVE